MAKIFDKVITSGADRTLVLDTREGLVYPIPYADWNILRVGMFFSLTTPENDNESMIEEDSYVSRSIYNTHYMLGVKHNNSNFPGVNGECFAGVYSTTSQLRFYRRGPGYSYQTFFGGDTSALYWAYSNGVLHGNGIVNGSSDIAGFDLNAGTSFAQEVNYARFFIVSLELINKGLSNQQIKVSTNRSLPYIQHSDTSDSALENLLFSSVTTSTETHDFNLSGVPYSVPNAIFSFFPFMQARMRIHNIGVTKVE